LKCQTIHTANVIQCLLSEEEDGMLRRVYSSFILIFVFLFLSVLHFSGTKCFAASNKKKSNHNSEPKLIQAIILNEGKIILDGILDEEIWQNAPCANHFTQQEPHEGEPSSERTDVKVVYDQDAIYVGVYAYDSEPDKIQGLLTRRDQESPSDWINLAFDSYADQRTAFEFAVNPVGVKLDAIWSDDTNRDENWDAVWNVTTKIVADGWIAEFRIPLNQLRFSNVSNKSWGFQIMRRINRNNEVSFWKHVPRNANGMVSLFGQLEGVNNIGSPKYLQVMPYVVSSGNTFPEEEGNPFRTGTDFDSRLGGDIKYGLTSNLTLDMTLNPDFGQVEADPSELNLSAFETFFEEKRPFFIEGSNIFNYNIGIGDGGMGSETLFYSRRIGRNPQHYPDVPDEYFVEQPQQTKIIGAAKLTGKTPDGLSIGILEAVTANEKANIDAPGGQYREIVEPRTNYFVARVQKDLRNGRTTVGGLVTNVYRNINAEHLNFLNRKAFSGGLDVNHRWGNDQYNFNAKIVGSYVSGDSEALDEVQTSSTHYFQRPDASHLTYDPTKTSLGGYAGSIMTGKVGGGNWNYGFAGIFRSPGFEINDIGYQQNSDMMLGALFGEYHQFEPSKAFRRYGVNYAIWYGQSFGKERLTLGGNINANFQFLNYWSFRVNLNSEIMQLATSLLRGGPAVKVPNRYNFNLGINSDERKRISGGINGNYSTNGHGTHSLFLGPNIDLRPTSRFNMSLFVGINPELNDIQYVDDETDQNGNKHYVLSKLDRKTVFLMARFNYTLTPNLTIQFYGQPFFTAGTYSNFKEVVNPRAGEYDNRFQSYNYGDNPNFNFKQFRSNLVMRWEYSPGSTLFLVWSQGRTGFEEMGAFSFRRDFSNLFDQRSENVFLFKFNRWFSF
jgi:hypothetical protein